MLPYDPLIVTSFMAIASFLVTLLGMPFWARLAIKLRLVDQPGLRKVHANPTPLCGGLAIFVPFSLTMIVLGVFQWQGLLRLNTTFGQLLSIFIASSWMLALGVADDRYQLSWKQKLLGQLIGVLILVLGGHSVQTASLPLLGPIDFGIAGPLVFGFVVLCVTNAVNLIDGLDGVAGGICFFAAIVYGIVGYFKGDYFACFLGFVLSGSLLGFLPYNLPPAKFFLGDSGSLMLGFLLGTLATSYAANQFEGQRSATFWVVLAPFLPFTVALLDVAIAIMRRWIRGGHIFLPDSDHLHHRLLNEFKSTRKVLAVIYAMSFLAALLSLYIAIGAHSDSRLADFVFPSIFVTMLAALVLKLYRAEALSQTILDRPHFKFLDLYRDFMSARMRLSQSEDELIGLLESGVRDLGFHSVEVKKTNGDILGRWIANDKMHSEKSSITLKRQFKRIDLRVIATIPKHASEVFQEYLESIWIDVLMEFRKAYTKVVLNKSVTEVDQNSTCIRVVEK